MPPRRRNRRLTLLTGAAIAIVAAPIAIADPLQGGQRNPHSSAQAYSGQTQVIAANTGYGLRVSNQGPGGAIIDGCRNGTGNPACMEAVGLKAGLVFSFVGNGNVGGSIHLANPKGAPFTTNATGVATGLNANFLQGHPATDFLGVTAQAADSARLGGIAASSYVQTSQLSGYAQTNQLLFAVVSQNGALGANRGATAAASTGGTGYTVTFSSNVSRCSYTASPTGPALTGGQLGVALDTTNPDVVDVTSPAALPQGFHLQVIC